jgi:SAM-dependent methyltransferase
MTQNTTRHLDLGCGSVPRNPYSRNELFGVDIGASRKMGIADIRQANLALQAIPFPNQYFDSVSAFDFLEHIPRVMPSLDGLGTRFPFIELMNEIHRVLKPAGLFYALTPCYPAAEAFQDPTHVNIMTDKTYRYFTGPEPLGRMYGFTGNFEARRVEWVVHKDAMNPLVAPSLSQKFRKLNYHFKKKFSHVAWEFLAQ